MTAPPSKRASCADGMHYLAMEHLVGSDLAQLVKRFGPQPAARVIHFGIGACLALEETHEKGFVHRDVKPGNSSPHASTASTSL